MKNYIELNDHYDCRCVGWYDDTENEKRAFFGSYAIFGEKEYQGDIYLLIEREDYKDRNYFMVKKNDILKYTDYELY